MKAVVARWGNSLGVRIPKEIARQVGIREGTRVEIGTVDNQIRILPARPHYRLEELLQGMTPETVRRAFDWGPDRGRESVEE